MNSFRKRASRIGGHEALKVKFSIYLHEISIPLDANIPVGSSLSVCFERGGKISSSKEFMFHIEQQSPNVNPLSKSTKLLKNNVFEINQNLELLATLYKSKQSGTFCEKKGKLYLRRLVKKGVVGSDSYQGIAMHEIVMHTFVEDMGYENSKAIDMQVSLDQVEGTILKYTLMATIVRKNDDDAASISSMLSDSSEMSTIGASFDYESTAMVPERNLNQRPSLSRSNSNISLRSDKDDTDVSEKRSAHFPQRSRIDLDASATHRKDVSAKDQQIARLEHSLTTQAQLYKAYIVSLTSALNTSKLAQTQLQIERDKARSYLLNLVQQSNEATVDGEADVRGGLNVQAMVESGVLPAGTVTTQPSEVSTSVPIQPIKQESHQAEKESRTQVNFDASMEFANEMLAAMFPRGGDTESISSVPLTLTAFAAATRRDHTEEDDGFQQVVKALSEDLEQYKTAAEQAHIDAVEERRATRDAATAVMEANMRRAQVQMEADTYLSELIEVKVRCADMAIQLDEENKKMRTLKARLQMYAEAIGSMEIRYCSVTTGATVNLSSLKSGSGHYAADSSGVIPAALASSTHNIQKHDRVVDKISAQEELSPDVHTPTDPVRNDTVPLKDMKSKTTTAALSELVAVPVPGSGKSEAYVDTEAPSSILQVTAAPSTSPVPTRVASVTAATAAAADVAAETTTTAAAASQQPMTASKEQVGSNSSSPGHSNSFKAVGSTTGAVVSSNPNSSVEMTDDRQLRIQQSLLRCKEAKEASASKSAAARNAKKNDLIASYESNSASVDANKKLEAGGGIAAISEHPASTPTVSSEDAVGRIAGGGGGGGGDYPVVKRSSVKDRIAALQKPSTESADGV